MDLPPRARVVVIGGGIIGCSIAYHLAHAGWDVLLLERDKLTSGTTWHAAGLMVTFGSTSETSTWMRQYSCNLYEKLEAETGQSTGFRRTGFIEVAADKDRLEEYRRVSAFNRLLGIDVHEISPKQVADLFPLAKTDDLLAGFYVKEDGRADPVGVTMALAKGARQAGAKLVENCAVLGVSTRRGAVTGVDTAHGHVEAEYVVNCAGMWARQLGAKSGVCIPNQAAEHYYLITERIPELSKDWPVLEDPGSYVYFREEVGGLMIGLFEPVCAPWNVRGIPDDFSFGEIQPDWERMGPYVETAMARVPRAMTAGVKKFFCGPESFTPDLRPIVGEAPELRGYFVAAGLNSIGILTGGGMGKVVADWIMTGRPEVDVTAMNIDRLHPYQANPEYRRTRTVESLGMVYKCHYPTHTMTTARGARRSPFYDRLAARGAYFRDVSGWEGADWYLPGRNSIEKHSWQRQHWWSQWETEHRAAREGAIVMDMSFMAKFLVQGRDAGAALDWISGNSVNGASGQITYTQWLDVGGKLQADLTVTKLADDRFWVVASDTGHGHVAGLLGRAARGRDVLVEDVTRDYAQLNLQGPRSRDVLAGLADADLSTDAWPFRGVREIEVAGVPVTCARITYLGELGYELYVAADRALELYDALAAGDGVRPVGLKALASLRMEKAYRDFGHDIDNTDCPLDVGLGFAVAWDTDFRGKDALLARKAAFPTAQRLVQLRLTDPEPLLYHAEPVLRDGEVVGYLRSASYGWTLGASVGLAFVTADQPITRDWLDAGTWEVDIAGERYAADVSLRP
nr:FAD-dependent oxidoreductase [Kofleriaceae bacterium]